MEMFLLLFLLSAIDRDPSLKHSLNEFLSFYRENRELVAALSKDSPAQAAATTSTASTDSTASSAEKNRPLGETGAKTILEEYLKRAAL